MNFPGAPSQTLFDSRPLQSWPFCFGPLWLLLSTIVHAGIGQPDYWVLPVPAQGNPIAGTLWPASSLKPEDCAFCHPMQLDEWRARQHRHQEIFRTLAEDRERTAAIADETQRAVEDGRKVLVLTDAPIILKASGARSRNTIWNPSCSMDACRKSSVRISLPKSMHCHLTRRESCSRRGDLSGKVSTIPRSIH